MAADNRVVFHEGQPLASIDLVLLCDVGITGASGAFNLMIGRRSLLAFAMISPQTL